MAEFQKVMRQAQRICEGREYCNGCPLEKGDEVCFFDVISPSLHEKNIARYCDELEAIVITWAKEHPESRYPTWGEWFAENFPSGNSNLLNPCAFIGKKFCEGHLCYECKQQPIPAEIAEKLGVKPKELNK